jgi:translation initiation factor 1A
MPKNLKKKKNKKNSNKPVEKRVLIFKEELQEYAKIIKLLGDRKVTLLLSDNSECLGIIPGRFRKRVWMKTGDIVLVSRRDFQDNKLDIIYKYNDEEKRTLVKKYEIPEYFLDDNHKTDNENIGNIIISNETEEDNLFDFDEI